MFRGIFSHSLRAAAAVGCHQLLETQQEDKRPQEKAPSPRRYSLHELSQHDGVNDARVWVSFKRQVFDITEFVDKHPGSKKKIMLAAGGAIDDFWRFWVIHTENISNKNSASQILKQYYIGELCDELLGGEDEEEVGDVKYDNTEEECEEDYDYWQNEPSSTERNKRILEPGKLSRPFQAESPFVGMFIGFITPNDMFYVRNHAPTPDYCDPHLSIEVDLPISSKSSEAPSYRPITLNKESLQRLPKVCNLPVTLQCSGNRLGETSRALESKNLHNKFTVDAWMGHGLISTAMWSGVRMSDVLKQAGITQELLDENDHHFEQLRQRERSENITARGGDDDENDHDLKYPPNSMKLGKEDITTNDDEEESIWWLEMYGSEGYSNAIPLSLALDPSRDVLIAYEMNGEPLPRDHGNPLRVIAPGVAGAKSVKWLNRLVVKRKSRVDSPWFNRIYRDSHSGHIFEWPVQSFIQEQVCINGKAATATSQLNTQKLSSREEENGSFLVSGFAYSGGGRSIDKVQVSLDNGITWPIEAQLLDACDLEDYIGTIKEDTSKEIDPCFPQLDMSTSSCSEHQQQRQENRFKKKEYQNSWTWTKWSVILSSQQRAQIMQQGNVTSVDCRSIKGVGPFLCCRAIDSSGDVQPDTGDEALDKHPSGYFYNPVHRVPFSPR